MPAVAKTSREQIVRAARRLISRRGIDALSLQTVASAVGVKAPSLYKHFADRGALIEAVVRGVVTEIQDGLERVAVTRTARGDLRAMAYAQRAYAQKYPHLYGLIFAAGGAEGELRAEEYARAVGVMLDRLRVHGPSERALMGARLLVAYTHGYITMERAGAFRLGGSLDEAFAFGIERILDSLARRASR